MQPHGRVRVGVDARDPGRGLASLDAELLAQLADQCCARILVRLDLAAGKLPVARIRLAPRGLRQKKSSVGAVDDGRGGFGQVYFFFRPPESRANCPATPPPRE